MPTAADRKQPTATELFTVDENQKHEQQSASHIEDSDTEVTLRLPNHSSEQPSTHNQPTATPINQSGMESGGSIANHAHTRAIISAVGNTRPQHDKVNLEGNDLDSSEDIECIISRLVSFASLLKRRFHICTVVISSFMHRSRTRNINITSYNSRVDAANQLLKSYVPKGDSGWMASRPKRKRTANKRSDPPATATQPSASASSEDMTTLLQQCMSKIMPTIEDTFKTCITDYFSNTNPTATPQPQPLEHTAAIQPPTLLHEITGGSLVSSSATVILFKHPNRNGHQTKKEKEEIYITMEKIEKIMKCGEELVNKGFQLQGCMSNMNLSGQNRANCDYLWKTLTEIRNLGSEIARVGNELKPAMKSAIENEERLKRMRLDLSKVKKEKIDLEKRIKELEAETSLYSFDEESLLGSQQEATSPVQDEEEPTQPTSEEQKNQPGTSSPPQEPPTKKEKRTEIMLP
uniref:Uncharacterized protein n=1 Tax=Magallana gigas TaxID=29159 RepID=A0A8W8NU86_MAGGI